MGIINIFTTLFLLHMNEGSVVIYFFFVQSAFNCLQRSEEGIGVPGAKVTYTCELLTVWGLGSIPRSLQEYQVFLTSNGLHEQILKNCLICL